MALINLKQIQADQKTGKYLVTMNLLKMYTLLLKYCEF